MQLPSALREWMDNGNLLLIFRTVFILAAMLCLPAALLVTVSLFIPERAPQSDRFLYISVIVSAVFLGAGALIFGIQSRIAAMAAALRDRAAEQDGDLARHFKVLMAYLAGGGAVLCIILAFMVYVILARIDQGFAVFG